MIISLGIWALISYFISNEFTKEYIRFHYRPRNTFLYRYTFIFLVPLMYLFIIALFFASLRQTVLMNLILLYIYTYDKRVDVIFMLKLSLRIFKALEKPAQFPLQFLAKKVFSLFSPLSSFGKRHGPLLE